MSRFGPVVLKANKDDGTARCQQEITRYMGNWPSSAQCGYAAVVGDRCRIHDPAKLDKKQKERQILADAKWQHRRKEIHGARFFKILEIIAEGHNDPRTLAKETIDEYNGGL